MIDHVSANVTDVDSAKELYRKTLEPLGYTLAMEGDGFAGFANPERIPDFWLGTRSEHGATHIAFRAPDRATVDRFHEAALAAGATDNGPPGVRAHYHENYYAAYVLDGDGNNVEAVCHEPQ